MVNLGIVGGRRGHVYREAAQAFPAQLRIHAVCDVDDAELDAWRRQAPDIIRHRRLDDLLADADVEAVYIATPALDHAPHAIACLAAGKHVLCEIPAVLTLEDGYALVEAVKKSQRIYMLAENYCYIPELRLVRRLCEEGRFGDITYAEGQYLHDCRSLFWTSDGHLTWRGMLRRDFPGNSYPTHSLGPIAQWLGLGVTGRDELVSVAAYRTSDRGLAAYARENWGNDHPSTAEGFFNHGDRIVTILTTLRRAIVVLQLDTHSPRPAQKAGFTLQGTMGAYVSGRYEGEDGLMWLDNGGPNADSTAANGWRSLEDYGRARYAHEPSNRPGRRPVEFMVLADFLAAIEGRCGIAIDVYDAVTWSVVAPLSRQSIEQGGRSVAMPAFRPPR
jgi:predicted dehydrogenase